MDMSYQLILLICSGFGNYLISCYFLWLLLQLQVAFFQKLMRVKVKIDEYVILLNLYNMEVNTNHKEQFRSGTDSSSEN